MVYHIVIMGSDTRVNINFVISIYRPKTLASCTPIVKLSTESLFFKGVIFVKLTSQKFPAIW